MKKEQQFYKGDIALLEIQTGVFVQVEVIKVVPKFGKIYYEVKPVKGSGQMRVEKLEP